MRLVKMVLVSAPHVIFFYPRTTNLNQDTFPGLGEMWPLNERDIAKSVWVPRAEMLLLRGINLLDKTGKAGFYG
ncbi:hypothetical protein C8J57DRAFT_1515131 [Mycena rebaudengoi]|nr:hypothetical protein C8J57DRAFT_1515131 [Mycena rebaudengoi]